MDATFGNPFNVDFETEEFGGEAGVLTTATDCETELIVWDSDGNFAFAFVDINFKTFGGSEGSFDVFDQVIAVFDDVDFFTV